MVTLQKCIDCNTYTLKKNCGCGGEAVDPAPPSFSFPDQYGEYRRTQKLKTRLDNNQQ